MADGSSTVLSTKKNDMLYGVIIWIPRMPYAVSCVSLVRHLSTLQFPRKLSFLAWGIMFGLGFELLVSLECNPTCILGFSA